MVTGMRISEVLRLDQDDIDWTEGVLTVRETKYCKSRLVPLHPTTVSALLDYARQRDRACRKPRTASFLSTSEGGRLGYYGIRATFVRLSREIGLGGRPDSRGPRMHDFRHRRAVVRAHPVVSGGCQRRTTPPRFIDVSRSCEGLRHLLVPDGSPGARGEFAIARVEDRNSIMKKSAASDFPRLLQAFFTDRLMQQRKASPHTIASRTRSAPSQVRAEAPEEGPILAGD